MAQTRINPADQIPSWSILRSHLNTSIAGSAVITKVIVADATTGLSIYYTGADAGTGDVTLAINGVMPQTARGFGGVDFFGTPGSVSYSSVTNSMVSSNGNVFIPSLSLPAGEAAIANQMVNVGIYGVGAVDFGNFNIGASGVTNDLGKFPDTPYVVIDLGSFP